MRFTDAQMNAFRDLSGDNNPLHCDPAYALTTPFGQVVVFGVAGILMALGEWAQGRKISIKSVKAQFKRPLFLNTEYSLGISETENAVVMKIKKGDWVQQTILLNYEERKGRGNPLDPKLKLFGIQDDQFLPEQLSALFWTSYYVGMVTPGRQALFGSLSIEFQNFSGKIDESRVQVQKDDRFNLYQISGEEKGFKFNLVAYKRPVPIHYPITVIKESIQQNGSLAGKKILITGAGRGFGAVLAKVFGLLEADVLLVGRSKASLAEVQKELESVGAKSSIYVANLAKEQECRQILEEINADYGLVDGVINNAFPVIIPQFFNEQTLTEFFQFINSSLVLTTNTLRVFSGLIKDGGFFGNVSSIFVKSPAPQFSHYVTAKAAAEGLVNAFSSENKNIRFLQIRLPRMLTDQTNVPHQMEDLPTPIPLANAVAVRLTELEKTKANLIEWDF